MAALLVSDEWMLNGSSIDKREPRTVELWWPGDKVESNTKGGNRYGEVFLKDPYFPR